MTDAPEYLRPYIDATKRFGAGFRALLWANERTQRVRFAALARLAEFKGKSVLDVGCGRADLLPWLRQRRLTPHDYFGLEAMEPMAVAAEQRALPDCQIIRGDFVADPAKLFVGAETVVFCGSLNTLDKPSFERTLRFALDATAESVVFNFLCSPERAAAGHLTWHAIAEVAEMGRRWTPEVRWVDDYLSGDCTMLFHKACPT